MRCHLTFRRERRVRCQMFFDLVVVVMEAMPAMSRCQGMCGQSELADNLKFTNAGNALGSGRYGSRLRDSAHSSDCTEANDAHAVRNHFYFRGKYY
jgi:hypothetical protein